jgi:DNA-3-methyladenine glycosylase I
MPTRQKSPPGRVAKIPARSPAPAHVAQPGRCKWCLGSDEYIRYHDEEWGVPEHDDRALFELLTLEGAQAGLSWSTVLAKRSRYRQVFRNFDPKAVSRMGPRDVARLMGDAGIIRNRLKIESTITNAKAFLSVQSEFGSFNAYLWRFVGGLPVVNKRRQGGVMPASTPISDALSKDLKARGFRFVGTTICYAFMQATGMVNDHVLTCFRHPDHHP